MDSKMIVILGHDGGIGYGKWGKGETLEEAKRNFRKVGGVLGRGYSIVTFPEGTTFEGVDQMGYVHYTGTAPTSVEVAPTGRWAKRAKARA